MNIDIFFNEQLSNILKRQIMKKINLLLIVLLLLLQIKSVNGQCTANAGFDKEICNGWWGIDTTQLGGDPSIIGGIPPYTFIWETTEIITIGTNTYKFTASDFLNDTTLSNPSIIYTNGNPLEFILTVIDGNNNTCKDTVLIKFSNFGTTLGYFVFNIQQGDSIFLNFGTNIGGGTPPYQYLWKPNLGLTDSTSLIFWAKPDNSVDYYVTVTDSFGCIAIGAPLYVVNVHPVYINQVNNQDLQVSVFPNPSNSFLNMVVDRQFSGQLLYEIFDIQGRLIQKIKTDKNTIKFSNTSLSNGLNFYKISSNGKTLRQGEFIINNE